MRPMRKTCLGLGALLGLLVAAGCARTVTVIAPPAQPEGTVMMHRPIYEVEDVTWVLFELEGRRIELTGNPRRPALRFDSANLRVRGSGGVNLFHGSYNMLQYQVKIAPMSSTRMAGPEEKMELERRFFAVLGRVTTWTRKGDLLALGEGAQSLALFTRQTEPIAEPWRHAPR